MTRRARIRNSVLVSHLRSYEPERVGVNKRRRHAFSFNGWHVARDTLTSRASGFVVRVFLESGCARAVCRRRAMTIQTDLIRWLSQLSVILRSMNVVATRAGNSVPVHHALSKVVALHAILVRRAIGKIVKTSLP